MKVSKGKTQPDLVAEFRLSSSLRGSGSIILVPGFDCDSFAGGSHFPNSTHEWSTISKKHEEAGQLKHAEKGY